MADRYCPNCKRMVGTKKNYAPGLIAILIGVALVFLLPFFGWMIGLALALIGILMTVFSGKRCPMCGSSNLQYEAPTDGKSQEGGSGAN